MLCHYCWAYVCVCAVGSILRSFMRGGVGDSVGDSSPGLHSLRPYILVLPPGGDADFVALHIAGVNSAESAAITLHSDDE